MAKNVAQFMLERLSGWDSGALADQLADAWDEALAADQPVLYEAVTDPEVPPLPPHIRFEQAKQ